MNFWRKLWKKQEPPVELGGEAAGSSSASAADDTRAAARGLHREPSHEEQIEEIRGYIGKEIAGGFRTSEEIQDWLIELMDDQYTLGLEGNVLAEQLLQEGLERHRQDQRSWPEVTDCDRLDSAFREMEEEGIVARQNFTCCQTCGLSEIGDEIREFEQRGIPAIGYVYYHSQDTERAVEGEGLYLAFGMGRLKLPGGAVEVPRKAASILRKHGLAVEWDGEAAARILVKLDWKRRRSDGKAGVA